MYQLRGPTIANISVATNERRTQILVLIPLSNKRNQASLKKWLILGVGQEIHNMGLEHLVVPESKEISKAQGWEHIKSTQKTTGRAPNGQSWDNIKNSISKVALNYNETIQ